MVPETNPVLFEQEAGAGLLTHNLGNPFRVGYHEIIPNHLDAYSICVLLLSFSVILDKRVFNGYRWILWMKDFAGKPSGQAWCTGWSHRRLEVHVILSRPEEQRQPCPCL